MTVMCLVRGNEIIGVIDDEDKAVTALPLMGGKDSISLISLEHVKAVALVDNISIIDVIAKLALTVDSKATDILDSLTSVAIGVK